MTPSALYEAQAHRRIQHEYNNNTTRIQPEYKKNTSTMTQLIRTWIAKKEEVIMNTFRDIVEGIYNAERHVMEETW